MPEPGAILVWRQEQVSRFRAIDAAERDALTLVSGGATFADLCIALVEDLGEAEGIARAGGLLGQWLSDGLISTVETSA